MKHLKLRLKQVGFLLISFWIMIFIGRYFIPHHIFSWDLIVFANVVIIIIGFSVTFEEPNSNIKIERG